MFTLNEDKSNMDKKVINLEQKIQVLESSCVTSSLIPSDKFILEIKNRLDKLNNLILYDVPEDLTPDNNFDYLINLFGAIDKNLYNLSFKRLGIESEKDQPIQISSDNKNNIKKLYKVTLKYLKVSRLHIIRPWFNVNNTRVLLG